MKQVITTLVVLCLVLTAHSQAPSGAGSGTAGSGRFYGRIIDHSTEKGVDAASVQLISVSFDSASGEMRDKIVTGMLTKRSGDFALENVPVRGRYKLFITAIGYKPLEKPVSFELPAGRSRDMAGMLAALDRDLGNLKVEQDADVLASVTVTGEKPMMQMGIDRKIFNVDKNITSSGGTAVDVMRNIPALNVDIEGNVTLRNSAPQIYVDGRASTLSLDQIPSDAIESVEMITNPSAKFDASGGQSGILNIVLKKNRRIGYNGGLRLGVDSRGKLSSGADMNVRQGKINVFASAFFNQRKSKSWGETDRVNFSAEPETTTFQESEGVFDGNFAFARFGLDYFINNRNTLTVSQGLMGGRFDMDNNNNLIYKTPSTGFAESQYRNTIGQNKWNNYSTSVAFKHIFAKPGREWTADINFNRSPSSGYSNIHIQSFQDLDRTHPKFPQQLQNITTSGSNSYIVAQTDYVHPLTENMKWEAGLRSQTRTYASNQLNYLNGISQRALDNEFEYSDYVHAAYGIFSQKIPDIINYQVGLRVESSNYSGQQIGKQTYSNRFPASLFPSVFLTRTIGENQDVQVNYSRKINRPSFFQLMPNTDFSDTLNLETGNPDLRPEFTNSLEVSYQLTYGERSNIFLVNVFGKHTTDLISRYQSLMNIGDTTAFVSSFVNADKAYAMGVEIIFRNKITDWWELNVNTNVYYSKINGSNVIEKLENERTSSFSKLNNTFKIAKTWSLQLSADYRSKSALPVSTSNSATGRSGGPRGGPSSTTQGYIDANYGVDLGIRKDFKIKKNQASVSFNISDLLNTRKHIVHSEAAQFTQDEWRRRDPQIARLNFSYRFGKFDASLFRRKNTRTESDNMGGMEGQ